MVPETGVKLRETQRETGSLGSGVKVVVCSVVVVVVVIVVVVAVVPRCFSLARAVSGRWLSSSDAHNQFFWRKTKKRFMLLSNDEL